MIFRIAILIGLNSAAATNKDAEINHVLRIHSPIFLKTSEEFLPDNMDYLAVDGNGQSYNIEGNLVKLLLTGMENFHGKFLPTKTVFPETEYRFVGHVNLPVNTCRIIMKRIKIT